MPRTCDITKELMESGYVVHDGTHVKYESDLIKLIIKYLNSIEDFSEIDNNTLMNISYNMEFHYFTEWEADE